MSIPCRKAFSQEILVKARDDKDIVVLCTDSRGSVMIGDFANELPEQFIEVGIAEQNCVGLAAGLANAGMKPFVAGPACFYSMRSAEQVKVDIAYSNSNAKIIGISGGVSYGALGTSHHSLQDIATMTAVPGLTVILPADAWQTKQMTSELTKHRGPVYVRMGRGAVPDIYGPEGDSGLAPEFKIGEAIEIMQGTDIAIYACGETVWHAYQAGKLLQAAGVSASVVDLHTLMPFDRETVLKTASKCRAVLTVEEHSVNGGLGSIIAGLLSENEPKKMRRIALPNENIVTGSSSEVFNHYGLTADNIANVAREMLEQV